MVERTEPEAVHAGRLPDFIIIGAMKAGTTSLGIYLDAHADIRCMGETHFFCCNHEQGSDWYRAQFSDVGTERIVGEKTPHYLADRSAIDRMAELIPGARLIAILRDPVDRALSHYWHNKRRGREVLDLREAMAAEVERSAREGSDDDYGYIERGRYLAQLQHVSMRFPRTALKVLLFEDLRDRPDAAFAESCRFLGVEPGQMPDVLGERANPYREHKPEWLWRMMFRRRLWRFLPDRAAATLGRWMTRETEYPPAEPGLRAELADVFAADNRELARWLGRDLSAWT